MSESKIYDIIGIGIGPFNLGLAALAQELPELNCLFMDSKAKFDWHPGMLIPGTRMQVPFYADLVTLVDPCSRFSYLAYLKSVGRLFKFAINETYIPYRSEFNTYCQWVAGQLPSLRFGITCNHITYNKRRKLYKVEATDQHGKKQLFHGKHIVIGIGTTPAIPACVTEIKHRMVFHSSEYLMRKEAALMHKRITIIGAGQSAAEIFLDLLPHMPDLKSLNWYTRSARFHPMETSKLTVEMSSPDYINYFHALDLVKKKEVLQHQQYLFKGINNELINEIYQQLYWMELNETMDSPQLMTGCSLKSIKAVKSKMFMIELEHSGTSETFSHQTDVVILATGYTSKVPDFLNSMQEHIQWQEDGNYQVQQNYSIDRDNTLFVQNAELHSHGFNSADLGLGPYRNAIILNTILKRDQFKIEKSGSVFQDFSPHTSL